MHFGGRIVLNNSTVFDYHLKETHRESSAMISRWLYDVESCCMNRKSFIFLGCVVTIFQLLSRRNHWLLNAHVDENNPLR
jgi:hypothetical protein